MFQEVRQTVLSCFFLQGADVVNYVKVSLAFGIGRRSDVISHSVFQFADYGAFICRNAVLLCPCSAYEAKQR